MRILHDIINRVFKKMKLYNFYYFLESPEVDKVYSVYKNDAKIFLLATPTYGNIGDQAITVATVRFLNDYFPEYKVISIDLENIYRHLRSALKYSSINDIFLLQGGGNMGDLYQDIEDVRRFCIQHIKNNRIISMPTSINYTDSKKGRRELKNSIRIYSANKNLILIAREQFTYNFMKENYINNKKYILPDIVLYLRKYINNNTDRYIPMICLRREIESNLDEFTVNDLIIKLSEIFPNLFIFDTTVSRCVTNSTRNAEVSSMLNAFKRARFVVTDRMHGMIFCAITGTPCIAIKSKDNKIIGSYKWIEDFKFIKLLDKPDFDLLYCEIKKMDEFVDSTELADYIYSKSHIDKLRNIISGKELNI